MGVEFAGFTMYHIKAILHSQSVHVMDSSMLTRYKRYAATIQFSVLIRQEMQLTGCYNGNEMRNATCVETQPSKVPTRVSLMLFPLQ